MTATLTTVMMASVSGLGSGFDGIHKCEAVLAPPAKKVLGVLFHCRFFQSTAVSHQPPLPPKRMFCSRRNVWQGFGGIWRSLAR